MNNIPDDFPEIDWTRPADPHEIAQLRDVAKWPLWEKLEWLESAQQMVETMNAHCEQQARKERHARKLNPKP